MNEETQHFNKLFWFCCINVAAGVLFLIALCYIPVPKGSERFADNVQGFIEGSIVTAAMTYLLGGNLPSKKGATVQQADNVQIDQTSKAPNE
jgi:hypothetical protein